MTAARASGRWSTSWTDRACSLPATRPPLRPGPSAWACVPGPMSVSDPIPGIEHGADYRAQRFAILTGQHCCYKCQAKTRVSAVALARFEEQVEEGKYAPGEDTVLLTTITGLNPVAGHAI